MVKSGVRSIILKRLSKKYRHFQDTIFLEYAKFWTVPLFNIELEKIKALVLLQELDMILKDLYLSNINDLKKISQWNEISQA